MYYTYILRLSNNTFYIGYSSNLRERVREHSRGGVDATKKHLPVKLHFYAAFVSQKEATDFEQYLKTGSGFAFRKRHIS